MRERERGNRGGRGGRRKVKRGEGGPAGGKGIEGGGRMRRKKESGKGEKEKRRGGMNRSPKGNMWSAIPLPCLWYFLFLLNLSRAAAPKSCSTRG